MFGHKSLPSQNFQFAAKEPRAGLQKVFDQLHAGHRYRNKLCELERTRREGVQEVIRKLNPRLLELQQAMTAAKEALGQATTAKKAANAKVRAHKADKALVAAEKEARKMLKEISAEEKKVRAATYEQADVQAALEDVNEKHHQARLAARAESGLYYGTYLTVEGSCTSMRSGPPPKFLRWDGQGQLAVQIQGGMTWEEMEAGDNRIHLAPPEPGLPSWHMLWFRVTSEDRKPVWAIVPVKITRTPPPTAKIKWVYLQRRVVGQEIIVNDKRHCHAGRVEWSVMFSISDANGWAKPDLADEGIVAVNFGFRRVKDGLRVAYLVDDRGHEESLVLPDERQNARGKPMPSLASVSKARSIRGFRDQNFNAIQAQLLTFRQSVAARPDWWQEETSCIHQWRSPARMAQLVIRWRNERFDGDDQIFTAAEDWRKRDSHLGRYENGLRDGFANWRMNLYRNFAATLRRKYKTLVVGKVDLRDLAKKPQDGEGLVEAQRDAMRMACASLLFRCLKEVVAETVELDCAYATKDCHACGHRNNFDFARSIWHSCAKCGTQWDQDANHCRNLLEAHREHRYDKTPAGPRSEALAPLELEQGSNDKSAQDQAEKPSCSQEAA